MDNELSSDAIAICKRLNLAIDVSDCRNLSLRQLAIKFQCTHTTVDRWVQGKARPSFDAALMICKLLQISIEWLLTGKGIMEERPCTLDEYALIEIFRHLNYDQQRDYLSVGYSKLSKARTDGASQQTSQAMMDLISRDQK